MRVSTHTRTYTHTRGSVVGDESSDQALSDQPPKSNSVIAIFTRATMSRAFLLVIGLSLVLSLGYNLAKPISTAATTTNTVNFQARLESSDGAIAPDGNYNVEFKIYSSSTGGSALWTEGYLNSASHPVVVSNGYLTVNLGSITSFPSNMPWDQSLYVTMNVGGTGSTPSWDGEMSPRLLLTAVPYAFQAANATELQITNGSNVATLSFASSPTSTVAITLPNSSGTVCLEGDTACSFAPTTGGTGYIQNGLTLQTNANLNIQSTSTTDITATISALPSQTADLLRFENSSGTTALSGINANGNYYIQSGSYTGTLTQTPLTSGSATYDLPNYAGTQTLCTLESGNCAGSGGGVTSTGGTNNSVAVFSSTSVLRTGSIYDNGSGNVQIGNSTYSSPIALLAVGTANQLTITNSGALTTSGAIQGLSYDANTATGLTIGGTNATSVTIGQIGVGTTAAGSLTVGSIGTAANNFNLCSSAGLIASCSNTYVQSNPTSTQTGNINLQSAAAGTVGQIIMGASSQSADLFDLENSSGTILASVNSSGGLTLGNSSTAGKLVLGDGATSNKLTIDTTALTGTDTVQIPDTAGSTDTICLKTLANCAGSGGGVTTTTGTPNAVAVFTGYTTLRIGSIYDNGSGNVQIGNSTYSSPTALLAVGSSNQLTVSTSGDLTT
ncbi:MAG TPA: hypothetical protein VIH90_08695, partial [Candidatus Saccharimonadales bacterium]